MLTHHMSHVGVSPMCLHTAVYRGVGDQNPAAWDTFLYKDFQLSTGILIGLPKDLTFKTVLMSRLPRPPNKKTRKK